jgi:hypothetical protein
MTDPGAMGQTEPSQAKTSSTLWLISAVDPR